MPPEAQVIEGVSSLLSKEFTLLQFLGGWFAIKASQWYAVKQTKDD